MSFIRTSTNRAALALAAAALAAAPALAQNNASTVLTAPLSGVGGEGKVTAIVDTAQGQLCYMINTAGIDAMQSARISRGAEVITLTPPAGGASGGCMPLEVAMGEAMIASPEVYVASVEGSGATETLSGAFRR